VTQPDRPSGRGLTAAPSAVKRYALQHGLALYQPANLQSSDAFARLHGASADVLVVAAYGVLLPQTVLDIAPHGALNIHASLLPRWRGAAPIQRALLAGDAETGISIMKMDAGLDTGPIVSQHSLAIVRSDDAGSLHDRLARLGAEAIVGALRDLRDGRVQPRPQPKTGAMYARKVEKSETRLDWSRPAVELERAVRAFRPAPGATTTLGGEPLKVWRASVVAGQALPGTLVSVGEALVVACGEDALAISELQRAGGRRLGAAEFARGRALAPGTRLG
jgi:methionyl-tRNA formyltransferase